MTGLPSLQGAAWLSAPGVGAIFDILNRDGESGRAVGGAVRDTLLGRPVREVDFATTALPDLVVACAKAAGIKAVPTGIEHGTVTLVIAGRGHEVTTLREDVETDGRHAIVRFGRDWLADAERRDFTINSLSVEANGKLHDPVGGYADIVAGRVRFIGDPDRRIAEDRLRILRFFRFHAQCGAGALDRDGLEATIRGRLGLRELAAERVNHELRRLLIADGAADTITAMQDAGILQIILGGIGYLARFARVIAIEGRAGLGPSFARRLAALATMIVEDAERVTVRLRLSTADHDAISEAVRQADRWSDPPVVKSAKAVLYQIGREAFVNGLALAAAGAAGPLVDWAKPLASLADWDPPTFPIGGKDLMDAGVLRGPALGDLLKKLEAWWIDQDFQPDRAAILDRLWQIPADHQ